MRSSPVASWPSSELEPSWPPPAPAPARSKRKRAASEVDEWTEGSRSPGDVALADSPSPVGPAASKLPSTYEPPEPPVPRWNVAWPKVADLFEADGTLGTIEVLNTTRDEHRKVLVALEHSPWQVDLFLDSEPVPHFLHPFDALFEPSPEKDWSYLVTVHLDDNRLNLHFFDEYSIQFDFDWFDVYDQEGLDAMLDLMALLHEATDKQVQMERGFFVCDAQTGGCPLGPFTFVNGIRTLRPAAP